MKYIGTIAKLLIRFSETCEDDGSFDIGVDEARALALLGYLNRPFRNRLFFELTTQGQELIAAWNQRAGGGEAAPVYQWRDGDSGDNMPWNDCDKFECEEMIRQDYETRILFTAPSPAVSEAIKALVEKWRGLQEEYSVYETTAGACYGKCADELTAAMGEK